MTPAEALTMSLRRGKWYAGDQYGWACCPTHRDRHPSLKIYAGERQAVIVHCKSGCDSVDIIRALRDQGVWGSAQPGPREVPPPVEIRHETLSDWGRAKWRATRRITAGDIAGRYLGSSRGVPIPPRDGHLRWHHDVWLSDEHSGAALVALITDVEDATVMRSLQMTWLSRDARKIDRRVLKGHHVRGGCVRLWPDASDVLGLGEGAESSLALHKLTGAPVWACVTADNLAAFPLIDGVRSLVVAVDHDRVGIDAAESVRARYEAAGVRVRLLMSTVPGRDLADGGEVMEIVS